MQLAALDFIACATADVFAMTDSGSQLSSLVSGFRTYYGGGRAPTLRPNKKRLAAILMESRTIEWKSFEERVKKMIEEGQRVRVRGFGRSIYRQPRCPQCMCKSHLHWQPCQGSFILSIFFHSLMRDHAWHYGGVEPQSQPHCWLKARPVGLMYITG